MIAWQIKAQFAVQRLLIHEGQNGHHPAELSVEWYVVWTNRSRRKLSVSVVIVMQSDSDLFEVVLAARTPCGFTCLLRSWK